MTAAAPRAAAAPRRGADEWVAEVGETGGLSVRSAGDCTGPVIAARDGRTALLFGELAEPSGSNEPAARVLNEYLRTQQTFPERLRGRFAVAVWDEREGTLVAARDQVGIVPLFWAETAGGVAVSPSALALTSLPGVRTGLNRAAIADFLCHRFGVRDETYFEGVQRLAPGTVFRWRRDGRTTLDRYWNPQVELERAGWARGDELEGFDALLERAVRRCTGERPASIFLSGGADSISVALAAADAARRAGGEPPLALSIAFPRPEIDEQRVQSAVAAALALPLQLLPFAELVPPRELLRRSLELSATWPAPILNLWRPAYQALGAEGVAAGRDVILTGAGGDEWLTVDPDYMADLLRRARLARAARFARAKLRYYDLPPLAVIRSLVWGSGLRLLLGSRGRTMLRRVSPATLRARRLRYLHAKTPAWVAPDAELRRRLAERIDASVEDEVSRPEPARFYLRDAERELDHPLASMDHEEEYEAGGRIGAAIAHPYWDPDLVTFLFRVPPRLLLRGGREKGLVRSTLAERLPAVEAKRPKKVLATGYYYSVLREQGMDAYRLLGGTPALAELGIVDRRGAEGALRTAVASGEPRITHDVWQLLSMEAWLQPLVR